MFARTILTIASLVLLSNSALAADSTKLGRAKNSSLGRSITFAAKAAVPIGYYQLCKTDNPVCRKSGGTAEALPDGAVRLDDSRMGQLASVNAYVNSSIQPLADSVQYHVADVWNVGPKRGDCEDFALTKKAKLLKLGWPSSALLLAVAETVSGEQHVVLVARTEDGDFVLDNLRKSVVPWSVGLYRWKAIQAPFDTWTWYQFGTGTLRLAANNNASEGDPQSKSLVPQPAGG